MYVGGKKKGNTFQLWRQFHLSVIHALMDKDLPRSATTEAYMEIYDDLVFQANVRNTLIKVYSYFKVAMPDLLKEFLKN
jgi:hypothetical protein